MLAQQGYKVLEACDGHDALRTLSSTDGVQLVITDVMMPNMGGAELVRWLTVREPDLRIIVMSGYSDDPLVRSVEGVSSDLFLEKPFTATALIGKVRNALDRPWEGLSDLRADSSLT
jgi:two-component system cell cycle sensor histidine kinase/response regulator CckA